MGPFMLLFGIVVEHAYYAGQRCRGLQFEPDAQSAAQLERHGCIVRRRGHGVGVHAERPELPSTRWLVRSSDAAFASCTDGLAPRLGELPFLDGAAAVHESSGASDPHAGEGGASTWRLHAGEFVSARDLQAIDAPALAAALSPAQRHVPPAFVVRLPAVAADTVGRRYRIRFQARRTTWKYCLLGDWPQEAVQVVDLGRGIAFGEPAREELVDGQLALAIRSSSGIAMHERPPQRFQLRARGDAQKVLVKRLPVAGASQLSRETIAGVSTLVSEIYVYR